MSWPAPSSSAGLSSRTTGGITSVCPAPTRATSALVLTPTMPTGPPSRCEFTPRFAHTQTSPAFSSGSSNRILRRQRCHDGQEKARRVGQGDRRDEQVGPADSLQLLVG